jgi:peroxiredoxin
VTFVIDKGGTVQHVIHSELGIDRHIEEAIDTLKRLNEEQS